MLLREESDPTLMRRVVDEGYGPDLTDDELIELGRDPFLIAYALADSGNRCVVSTETSKPQRRRANRHVPDVCSGLGLACIGTVQLINTLDFRIR